MNTPSPVTRLVHTLTDEGWNKARRNSAARLIANSRSTEADSVERRIFQIEKQGVVGRYDSKRAELLRIVAEANGCAAHINSESYEYRGSRRAYSVVIFGYKSDLTRSFELFYELMAYAEGHLSQITGTDVGKRRRQWFGQFLSTIAARMQEIGAAPAVAGWITEHHNTSYAAREAAGSIEFHRESA